MLYMFFTADYDTGYYTHLQGVFDSEEKVKAHIQHLRDIEEAFYEEGEYRIIPIQINLPTHINLGY